MKPKSLLLLCVAGGCGLVAAIATAKHLTGNQSGPVAPVEPRKPVVVATADLEVGTQVSEDKIKVVEIAEKDLPEGTFATVAEVTTHMVRYPIYKGEPVLEAKLGRGLSALSEALQPGMVAQTVKVDDEAGGMTGLIYPGDHVDVYWLPMNPDLSSISVKLLLQNVKVLAVGQRIERDDNETSSSKESKSHRAENYTLLLNSVLNRRLMAANQKGGKYRLSLRGKGDKTVQEMDEHSLDIMLGLQERPKEATPEPTPEPVHNKHEIEYIKGNDISTESVDLADPRRLTSQK